MAASPAGGIVLVDSRNRRIVSVSADGVWEREVRLENLEGDVQHVIPLSSGNYLLTTTGEEPFPVVSAEGTTIGALPSPWPEGFGQMHAIQLQGRAVHWREDRWVFGFTAGNGWFTFDGVGEGSLRGTYPYVEHGSSPGWEFRNRATATPQSAAPVCCPARHGQDTTSASAVTHCWSCRAGARPFASACSTNTISNRVPTWGRRSCQVPQPGLLVTEMCCSSSTHSDCFR